MFPNKVEADPLGNGAEEQDATISEPGSQVSSPRPTAPMSWRHCRGVKRWVRKLTPEGEATPEAIAFAGHSTGPEIGAEGPKPTSDAPTTPRTVFSALPRRFFHTNNVP